MQSFHEISDLIKLFSHLKLLDLHVFFLGETSGSGATSHHIWVSGLSSSTKAADLKNLFGKYGKVN